MSMEMVEGDITKLCVDAIVNAANSGLRGGGGVDGAIHAAAGEEEMHAACRKIGHCAVGKAVYTDGFRLRAKCVIHTVGPFWLGGGNGEEAALESCYVESLEIAKKLGCRSVAFPCISTGVYGYPRAAACRVAVNAVKSWLAANGEMRVIFCVFGKETAVLYRAALDGIK